jgi:hypothetical protein
LKCHFLYDKIEIGKIKEEENMNQIQKGFLCIVILLSCILCAYGEGVEFPELKKPASIQIDQNQLFITEGPTISIYSMETFKLKKKFGKSGEGPQEFKGGIGLYINNNLLYVNSLDKVSLFSKEGEFLREMKLPKLFVKLIPFGENYLGVSNLDENKKRYILTAIYSNGLKRLKEIAKDKFFFQPGSTKLDVISVIGPDGGSGGGIVIYKDQIFRQEDSKICIYNQSGKKLKTIENIIQKVLFSDADKERYLNSFKTHPQTRAVYKDVKKRLSFSKFFPLIQNMIVDDDKIYVRTYKRENKKSEVYVIDLNGSLIKKVFVPFVENNLLEKLPYTIKNNHVYQLVEGDDETWELMKFKIL